MRLAVGRGLDGGGDGGGDGEGGGVWDAVEGCKTYLRKSSL